MRIRFPSLSVILISSGLILASAELKRTDTFHELQPDPTASFVSELVPGYDFPTLSEGDFLASCARVRSKLKRFDTKTNHTATSTQPVVFAELQNHQPQVVADLNDLVFQVIRHSDQLEIRWIDNWFQKGLALLYPPLREPQLPEQILQQQQGLCSDSCKVLQWQLQQAGIDSAFLGLGRHVVLLVRYDEQLFWTDPDFGIIAAIDSVTGRPDESQILEQLRNRGFSEAKIRTYQEILMESSEGTRLEWNRPLSPRLTLVAKISHWFVQLAPIILLAIGLTSLLQSQWQLEDRRVGVRRRDLQT